MKKKEKFDTDKIYTYILSQLVIAVILTTAFLIVRLALPDTYSKLREYYKNSFDDKTSVAEVLGTGDKSENSSDVISVSSSSSVSSDASEGTDLPGNMNSEDASSFTAVPTSLSVNNECIGSVLTEKEIATMGNNAVMPVAGRITSLFSNRMHPISGQYSFHQGVDIGADYGDVISAVLDGRVCVSRYDSTYGYYVVIEHSDGVKTLYAHCRKLFVAVDDKVTKGQKIAEVGSTGDSTGPHLHFELIVNGIRIDPMTVFTELGC